MSSVRDGKRAAAPEIDRTASAAAAAATASLDAEHAAAAEQEIALMRQRAAERRQAAERAKKVIANRRQNSRGQRWMRGSDSDDGGGGGQQRRSATPAAAAAAPKVEEGRAYSPLGWERPSLEEMAASATRGRRCCWRAAHSRRVWSLVCAAAGLLAVLVVLCVAVLQVETVQRYLISDVAGFGRRRPGREDHFQYRRISGLFPLSFTLGWAQMIDSGGHAMQLHDMYLSLHPTSLLPWPLGSGCLEVRRAHLRYAVSPVLASFASAGPPKWPHLHWCMRVHEARADVVELQPLGAAFRLDHGNATFDGPGTRHFELCGRGTQVDGTAPGGAGVGAEGPGGLLEGCVRGDRARDQQVVLDGRFRLHDKRLLHGCHVATESQECAAVEAAVHLRGGWDALQGAGFVATRQMLLPARQHVAATGSLRALGANDTLLASGQGSVQLHPELHMLSVHHATLRTPRCAVHAPLLFAGPLRTLVPRLRAVASGQSGGGGGTAGSLQRLLRGVHLRGACNATLGKLGGGGGGAPENDAVSDAAHCGALWESSVQAAEDGKSPAETADAEKAYDARRRPAAHPFLQCVWERVQRRLAVGGDSALLAATLDPLSAGADAPPPLAELGDATLELGGSRGVAAVCARDDDADSGAVLTLLAARGGLRCSSCLHASGAGPPRLSARRMRLSRTVPRAAAAAGTGTELGWLWRLLSDAGAPEMSAEVDAAMDSSGGGSGGAVRLAGSIEGVGSSNTAARPRAQLQLTLESDLTARDVYAHAQGHALSLPLPVALARSALLAVIGGSRPEAAAAAADTEASLLAEMGAGEGAVQADTLEMEVFSADALHRSQIADPSGGAAAGEETLPSQDCAPDAAGGGDLCLVGRLRVHALRYSDHRAAGAKGVAAAPGCAVAAAQVQLGPAAVLGRGYAWAGEGHADGGGHSRLQARGRGRLERASGELRLEDVGVTVDTGAAGADDVALRGSLEGTVGPPARGARVGMRARLEDTQGLLRATAHLDCLGATVGRRCALISQVSADNSDAAQQTYGRTLGALVPLPAMARMLGAVGSLSQTHTLGATGRTSVRTVVAWPLRPVAAGGGDASWAHWVSGVPETRVCVDVSVQRLRTAVGSTNRLRAVVSGAASSREIWVHRLSSQLDGGVGMLLRGNATLYPGGRRVALDAETTLCRQDQGDGAVPVAAAAVGQEVSECEDTAQHLGGAAAGAAAAAAAQSRGADAERPWTMRHSGQMAPHEFYRMLAGQHIMGAAVAGGGGGGGGGGEE